MKWVIFILMIYLYLRFASSPFLKKKRKYNGYEQYRDWWGRWRFTHRYVAQKKLGGKIWDGYVVHHRNENKLDNRSENLQVMRKDKHSRLHYWKRKVKRKRYR